MCKKVVLPFVFLHHHTNQKKMLSPADYAKSLMVFEDGPAMSYAEQPYPVRAMGLFRKQVMDNTFDFSFGESLWLKRVYAQFVTANSWKDVHGVFESLRMIHQSSDATNVELDLAAELYFFLEKLVREVMVQLPFSEEERTKYEELTKKQVDLVMNLAKAACPGEDGEAMIQMMSQLAGVLKQ